jgi:hypothetical protein
MQFDSVSSLLQNRSQTQGTNQKVAGAMMIAYFESFTATIFDEQNRASMRALYVSNGTMYVAVLSPSLAQELLLREPQIIDYINSRMGKKILTTLRIIS